MAKHLTDNDVLQVVELLDGWSGKLTWDLLCDACHPRLMTRPSRQTLSSFARIKDAFALAKQRLKAAPTESRRSSITLSAAVARLDRLEAEASRLKLENSRLLEQFVRWQYNAALFGLGPDELNRPLRSIDRGNTEP